jgi:hypothetical protein
MAIQRELVVMRHAKNFERKDPKKANYRTVKGNAKRDSKEFTIVLDDLLDIPDRCPVLGIKLNARGEYKGKDIRDCNASIDRIYNHLGYVPGNVHWVSYRANKLKADATVEELQTIANYYRKLQEENPEEEIVRNLKNVAEQ